MTKSGQKVHLFVLQHGLWGNHGHLDYIKDQLKETYKDKIHTLNVAVNEAKLTYDGVDICGNRLVERIHKEVETLEKEGKVVDKCSFFGYSLGGLISRYAVGVLGESGFFDKHEPINFTTFATPHLGIRQPSGNIFVRIFNWLSKYLLSRSGEQMSLIDKYRDGRSLLEIMASPDHEFMKHMARFQHRFIYANAVNDRSVPFWTAAFEPTNYFSSVPKLEIEYDESFCTVVKSYDLRDPSVEYTPPKKPFTKWTILKYVIFLLLPVLLPLWIIIAFSYVASQGLGSRIRVAGILRNAASKINDQSNNTKKIMPVEDSKVSPTVSLGSITDSTKAQQDGAVDVVDKFVEEAVLVPALDGMNFPGEANILKKDGSESSEDVIIDTPQSNTFNVPPGKRVAQSCKQLDLLPSQANIIRDMNKLSWKKVVLVIDSLNAHASIVVRDKRFDSSKARAGVKHYVQAVSI
ncbi:putative serine esterase-domain-containing protein [Umbelopsis sp. PMI_123]|nr:putative serine esterase-domain-containing protein [Umbelopsis sp. PMI_123]